MQPKEIDVLDFFFKPDVNYDGQINIDLLKTAESLPDVKKPLRKYLKKRFYEPLEKLLGAKYENYPSCFWIKNIPYQRPGESEIRRITRVDLFAQLEYAIFMLLTQKKMVLEKHFSNLENITDAEAVNILKKVLEDVYSVILKKKREENLTEAEKELEYYIPSNIPLEMSANAFRLVLSKFNSIKRIFDQEIDIDDLKRNLYLKWPNDYKYLLSCGHEILEYSKLSAQYETGIYNGKEVHILPKCFVVLIDLKDTILEKIKKEFKNSDYRRICIMINGKPYNLDDFVKDVKELHDQHPEFKVIRAAEVDGDLSDLTYANETIKKINYEEQLRELFARYNIIPNPNRGKKKSENPKPIVDRPKGDSQFNLSAMERQSFFDGTDYLFKLKGINEFTGYVGYIYENGKVFFEKFFEDRKSGVVPAKQNATYVMDIETFIAESKKCRSDIVSELAARKRANGSANERETIRLFHTKNWHKSVCQHISSVSKEDRYQAIIDKINEIIENGEIKRGKYEF